MSKKATIELKVGQLKFNLIQNIEIFESTGDAYVPAYTGCSSALVRSVVTSTEDTLANVIFRISGPFHMSKQISKNAGIVKNAAVPKTQPTPTLLIQGVTKKVVVRPKTSR